MGRKRCGPADVFLCIIQREMLCNTITGKDTLIAEPVYIWLSGWVFCLIDLILFLSAEVKFQLLHSVMNNAPSLLSPNVTENKDSRFTSCKQAADGSCGFVLLLHLLHHLRDICSVARLHRRDAAAQHNHLSPEESSHSIRWRIFTWILSAPAQKSS